MILKALSVEQPECVFKGGTSLSKCHHAIERFSEDIDIAFSNNFTQGMRKKLKNQTILGISESLGLPILDWENIQSLAGGFPGFYLFSNRRTSGCKLCIPVFNKGKYGHCRSI